MSLNLEFNNAQRQIFYKHRDEKVLVVSKGRRLGATRGGINYFAGQCVNGSHLLWGETIHANIDRYVDRFLIPLFKDSGVKYHYNRSTKQFLAGKGYIDFRSAEKAENWEGFGYNEIFLNEAGIILQGERGRDLFNKTVRPMLMDFKDSRVLIVGTPKGKTGKHSMFFELAQQYKYLKFSTYDNLAYLGKEAIDEFVASMPSSVVQQEIYGEFVDIEGTLVKREWLQYLELEEMPSDMYLSIGVDTASSATTSSDYTAITVAGYKDSRYYVLDVFRDKLVTTNQIANAIKSLSMKWNCGRVYIEKTGQMGLVIDQIQKELRGVCKLYPKTPTKDKYTRFLPIVGKYEQGLVFHRKGLPDYFEDELLSFSGQKDLHDDMIDSTELAVNNIKTAEAKVRVL